MVQVIAGTAKNHMSDEQLVEQANLGVHECFEELVHRYYGTMTRFVGGRTGSRQDAEEIVQDSFLKVYRNLGKFNSRYAFKTWLFTITRNCMLSHLRKKKLNPESCSPVDNIVAHAPQGPPPETAEEMEAIWQSARRLAPDQYMVIWLKYHEEMDINSIARAMGKTKVNVRVLLHRARNNLRRSLATAAV